MPTLETSVEANYDNDRGTPDRQKKRLIGARATALLKNYFAEIKFCGKTFFDMLEYSCNPDKTFQN